MINVNMTTEDSTKIYLSNYELQTNHRPPQKFMSRFKLVIYLYERGKSEFKM